MIRMPIADGVLDKQDGRDVIRFERRLDHPIERVWAALTEPSELIGWWGDADLELVEGGRFVMRWLNTDGEGNPFVMHATIRQLDPPRLLETEGSGHGVLRWELRPDGDGTILRFSSTLDLADEYRTMTLAGWHMHLDALAAMLAGESVDLVNIPGWEPLHQRYVAKLG
jgi:uncharacterized protein YndB with AHSA1/START domain